MQDTTSTKGKKLKKKAATAINKRLYVLDTNVLMHDPTSIYRFEEHDVLITLTTLSELDKHKTGQTDVARNTRQASRLLDQIIDESAIKEGASLAEISKGQATGRLFMEPLDLDPLPVLNEDSGDAAILASVNALAAQDANRAVILVSKDVNIRLRARALGLAAEDYRNDQVIDDTDLLPTGMNSLPADTWETCKNLNSWQVGDQSYFEFEHPRAAIIGLNEFVTIEGDDAFTGRMVKKDGQQVVLESVVDYSSQGKALYGVSAKNDEQNYALNLLMDPEIDFVTLLGPAGTGKTLLTLVAGLHQCVEQDQFEEILFTRATIPLGEDIGFLPGDETEKLTPWMGAIYDNLDVIIGLSGKSPIKQNEVREQAKAKLKVKAMTFMRGRTFQRKFLVVDEAQNLTAKQMKALITRAGKGTKVVCLGNLAQIDTPYLTEASSGLAYAVDRFKNWLHAGHLTLNQVERSRLAEYASSAL